MLNPTLYLPLLIPIIASFFTIPSLNTSEVISTNGFHSAVKTNTTQLILELAPNKTCCLITNYAASDFLKFKILVFK